MRVKKTFLKRIRNNKTNKIKKRLNDDVGYRGRRFTIKQMLEIDVHHLWWLYFENKRIDLTYDSEELLKQEMKRQDYDKWSQYNIRLIKKQKRNELIERVAKKNNVSSSDIHLKL